MRVHPPHKQSKFKLPCEFSLVSPCTATHLIQIQLQTLQLQSQLPISQNSLDTSWFECQACFVCGQFYSLVYFHINLEGKFPIDESFHHWNKMTNRKEEEGNLVRHFETLFATNSNWREVILVRTFSIGDRIYTMFTKDIIMNSKKHHVGRFSFKMFPIKVSKTHVVLGLLVNLQVKQSSRNFESILKLIFAQNILE